MALTAPYYTVGKQKAQWHRNKGEKHLAKATGWGAVGALAIHPRTRPVVGSVLHGVSGIFWPGDFIKKGGYGAAGIGGAHVGLAAYHGLQSRKITRDLKNRYGNSNKFKSTKEALGA